MSQIYRKYFKLHSTPGVPYQIDPLEQEHIYANVLKMDKKPALFAELFAKFAEANDIRAQSSKMIQDQMKQLVIAPVESILNYQFNDKNVLLEALTHKTFKEAYGLNSCYEKLEVLGDAILDYLANSNLIRYTMFEKYNIPERQQQQFITQEDFMPFDAHQAKSLLTKNDFLAKLVCLFGL